MNEKQLFDPRPFSRKIVKGNFFLICLERSQFPSGIFLILLILGCDLATQPLNCCQLAMEKKIKIPTPPFNSSEKFHFDLTI